MLGHDGLGGLQVDAQSPASLDIMHQRITNLLCVSGQPKLIGLGRLAPPGCVAHGGIKGILLFGQAALRVGGGLNLIRPTTSP